MTFQIFNSDCLAHLKTMPDNSVDSVVTDPPYGLSFMGKKWDYDVPSVEIWAECLRVLKPGGYLLAFAGTRTQHRMAVRIEDAGFEIRDMIAWVYGSGFPKSHNGDWGGTALKPALEPITMARKPLIGTVEANWYRFGTGALNIDGCRIGWPGGKAPEIGTPEWGVPAKKLSAVPGQDGETVERTEPHQAGRWPANLIHDGSDEVIALFPHTKTGNLKPEHDIKDSSGWSGGSQAGRVKRAFSANEGSAARFFYSAKASRKDRNEGCDHLEAKQLSHDGRKTPIENAYQRNSSVSSNNHPTVKPTDLMRYLCRLVTPAGGTVLDPFMGSGSTGKAAVQEGFDFIGIELSSEYVEIARARIEFAVRGSITAPHPQLEIL